MSIVRIYESLSASSICIWYGWPHLSLYSFNPYINLSLYSLVCNIFFFCSAKSSWVGRLLESSFCFLYYSLDALELNDIDGCFLWDLDLADGDGEGEGLLDSSEPWKLSRNLSKFVALGATDRESLAGAVVLLDPKCWSISTWLSSNSFTFLSYFSGNFASVFIYRADDGALSGSGAAIFTN